jgi:hypothetical protein
MVAPGLKSRYVDVYLPSEEAKREWVEEAKKAGLPMSKFVFEAVEVVPLRMRLPNLRWSRNSLMLKRRCKSSTVN